VRFAAFRNFATLVEPYGLEFAPVEADFRAIMDDEDGRTVAWEGVHGRSTVLGRRIVELGCGPRPILRQ
jgi:hypothetical protein